MAAANAALGSHGMRLKPVNGGHAVTAQAPSSSSTNGGGHRARRSSDPSNRLPAVAAAPAAGGASGRLSPPRAPSRAAAGFAGCGPPDGGPGASTARPSRTVGVVAAIAVAALALAAVAFLQSLGTERGTHPAAQGGPGPSPSRAPRTPAAPEPAPELPAAASTSTARAPAAKATEPGEPAGSARRTPARPEAATPATAPFVGHKLSKNYHVFDCRFAAQMSPRNRVELRSVAEARAGGFDPCGYCKPPR